MKSNKLKIAITRREYITHLDGVNRFIALLAEGLIKLGAEVSIISWGYNSINEDLHSWFSRIHGLDVKPEIITLYGKPTRGDPWVKIAWDWLIKGTRLLKDYDALIVNGVVPIINFRPKIAVNHGITLKADLLKKFLVSFLYRLYDRIICVSDLCAADLQKKLGVSPDYIIPLPLKPCKEVSEHRKNVVIHVGTRKVKNPEISLRAIEILREKGYDVKLIIVGGTSHYIESLIKAKPWAEFLSGISYNTLMELYAQSKALILPSHYEALPYSVIEAMACGTPPIVSSAVPASIVLDNFNGLRVSGFNPVDYANALERLLINEHLWKEISYNAMKFVERFEYQRIAQMYMRIIYGLISR